MSIVPEPGNFDQAPSFVPADSLPNYDSIITEDDKPVDSWYSERQLRLLTDALFASWKGPGEGRPRCVGSDIGLFFSTKEPPIVPDVLISLDVVPPADMTQKRNRSYFPWELGKNPDMTVEVVSNTIGGELSSKLKDYARIGIPYYVVWDPVGYLGKAGIFCFALQGRKYVPCEPWFPDLELGVTTWDGAYDGMTGRWLRFCDQQGNVLPTGIERAVAAEQSKEILAEKLRQLGIDPDQP